MSATLLDVCTELLGEGFCINFHTPGQSMYPTIRDGEKVSVEPVLERDIKRGDILLYKCHGRLIAHRVIRIHSREEKSLVLRGDALNEPDAPVKFNQVLGRVVAVERGGRKLKLARRKDTLRAGLRRLIVRLIAN
jgi:signal peptidase I